MEKQIHKGRNALAHKMKSMQCCVQCGFLQSTVCGSEAIQSPILMHTVFPRIFVPLAVVIDMK